ncbi:hypothetical protein Vretifemale_4704 [Volvox reticuliferus]|uniref:Uncharacterized protein n=1 Tax=Volvox reticuliferus TaxID=1737510 RepID=A0A8J4C9U7_9CHLO|nr:hypothetical protein Vretifemale_4704 [Volvox reticuliferus]
MAAAKRRAQTPSCSSGWGPSPAPAIQLLLEAVAPVRDVQMCPSSPSSPLSFNERLTLGRTCWMRRDTLSSGPDKPLGCVFPGRERDDEWPMSIVLLFTGM